MAANLTPDVPTVPTKVIVAVPAPIVNACVLFVVPVIAPCKDILLLEVDKVEVEPVRFMPPEPFCVIPPGAVIDAPGIVQVPEFVTVRAFELAKTTLLPQFTAPPVIVRVPRLVVDPILPNDTAPVPAATIRSPEPSIFLVKATGLSVVVNVILVERVTISLPFCVMPPGAIIVEPDMVHVSELVMVRALPVLRVIGPLKFIASPVKDKLPRGIVSPILTKLISPAHVTERLAAPLIEEAKLTEEKILEFEVMTVLPVKDTSPLPFCVILVGAVTVRLPIVQSPEFVTESCPVRTRDPPMSTVDPVITRFPREVPATAILTAPVPAEMVKLPGPLIARVSVTALFVVLCVTVPPDIVIVLLPF